MEQKKFNIGDTVYLKSDTARLKPMTVHGYVSYETKPICYVQYFSAAGKLETNKVHEHSLIG